MLTNLTVVGEANHKKVVFLGGTSIIFIGFKDIQIIQFFRNNTIGHTIPAYVLLKAPMIIKNFPSALRSKKIFYSILL